MSKIKNPSLKQSSLLRRTRGFLLGGLLLAGLSAQTVLADTATLSYDPLGNISSRTAALGTTIYTYDAINRLIAESGPAGNLTYAYDANGSRLSDSHGVYAYSLTSNRLTTRYGKAVATDAAGNITSDGLGHSYVYNQAGRLVQVLKGTTLIASYDYNYKGERTRKVTTASAPQGAQVVRYVYDHAGHLLEELNASGAPIRSYVWRDDTPLAQIEQQPVRRIFYFEVDQLNTPRVARDQSGTLVWRWESDAFGATLPNSNPSGLGAVTINLRFPGQYYDQESGLYYNGQRYYDPAMGQYTQPDRIGLAGGSFSTYQYAGSNPLRWSDPLGLWQLTAKAFLGFGGGVKISWNNGTLEVLGLLGTGLGTSFQFDPAQNPSEQSKSCGSGYIARTAFDIGAQLNAGIFSLGNGATLYSGNAITTPVGGDFVEHPSPSWFNLNPGLHPIGFEIGGSIAAEFGSYSNW